uniref:OSJNBb0096E05.13 protein n=1 Tax=Oryza sativa subsp. japonica TaxID=39947 RepID=Q7XRR0_ORYSJ|nr:OSJNBb0096E05.13 [Oryza sativa Japonica Group]
MKSPASSHREQQWLSSVYGSPAAIGGSNRFENKRENVENVLAHPGLDSAKGLVHVLSYGTRVLTKQRNGGSEVQGAVETVVVGQRQQNSGVDVAGSTQGANCNFESTGVLRMSHRGCMREESGGNSPELGVASVVMFHRREERGTHWGCTATMTKSPEPGKMTELWAFWAWGVFSWTWNAMWGVCCCFWCFVLGNKSSKKPGLEILLVEGDVESKCAEVDWVRSLWFRFDGGMNMG